MLAAPHRRGPSLRSWIAFVSALLFAGLCTAAWFNNDDLVAWGMAQGVVSEAATRTLPAIVKYASIAAGALGLIAALPVVGWAAGATYGRSPVPGLMAYLAGTLGPPASSGLATFRGELFTIARALASLTHLVGAGISTLATLVWRGLAALARPTWLVLRFAAAATILAALAVDVALRYVGRGVAEGLRYLWGVVAFIAQVVGVALRYVGRGIAEGLGYVWGIVALMVRAVGVALRYVGRGIAGGLGYLWGVVVIVGQAMGVALRFLGRGIAEGLGYLWRGVVIVGQAVGVALWYVGRGIAEGLGYLWRGVVIVARAVGVALRYVGYGITEGLGYLWRGVFMVARAAGRVPRYVGPSIAEGLRYFWGVVAFVAQAVGTALRSLVRGIAEGLRYLWGVLAFIAQAVGTALRFVGRGIAERLGSLWGVIAFVAQAVGVVLRYVGRGIAEGLGYLWLRVVIVARAEGVVLRYIGHGTAQGLHYIWRGVAIGGSAVGSVLRIVGRGIGQGLHYLWRVVAFVALAAGVALRYVGNGVVRGLQYLWRGIVAVAVAAVITLRYTGRGVTESLHSLWSGGLHVANATGIALRFIGRGAVQGLRYLGSGVAMVARAVGLVLQLVSRGVVMVARAIGVVLQLVWRGVVIVGPTMGLVLQLVWRGVAMVARAVGLALQLGWRGVVIVGPAIVLVLQLVWRGVAMVARAIGLVLQLVWRGVVMVARAMGLVLQLVWRGVVMVGRAIGVVLQLVWRGVAMVAREIRLVLVLVWRCVSFAGGVTSTMLRHLLLGTTASLHLLGRGIALTAQTAGVGLGYVWLGVAGALGLLLVGSGIVARAMLWTLMVAWPPVSFVVVLLWQGVGAIGGAIGAALVFLWKAVLTVMDNLRFGLYTAGLPVVWTLARLRNGLLLSLRGLVFSPFYAARVVVMAFRAARDVVRLVVWVGRNRKGVSAMSDFNLERERLVSLVVTMLVLFLGVSVAVRVFWPEPPEPTVDVVHWVTGHLYFGPDLPGTADKFNETGPTTKSGKPIVVKVYNAPSSEGARDLLSRVAGPGAVEQRLGGTRSELPDPTIVTPSGAHWLVTVNDKAERMVVDPENARSIARAYIGIVTFRDMAECLGWPDKEIGYADILALRESPDGWEGYTCADGDPAPAGSWGKKPLLAFTDPRTSSTGRAVLIALYSIAAKKSPAELRPIDVSNPKVVDYVKDFQRLIDHYIIGTTVLNTKIYQGPRYGHFFLMPEDNLIHLKDGTARAIIGLDKTTAPPVKQPMVMIYPKEGSMARNNCACVVNADWVTEEQAEAAEKWIDFILADEQQRGLMESGFRPTARLTLNDSASKIHSGYGLDPMKPTKELDPATVDPKAAAAIDASWDEVKRPGIVTFVVDTSGSMLGAKLQHTKDGMEGVIEAMPRNNQVGFLTFGDEINNVIPVAPIDDNQYLISEAVHEMRARGETALYDAIKKGIEMADAAEGDEGAIRAVVVLTDGRANEGRTRLDDLIAMEANEKAIVEYSGMEDGLPPLDEVGRRVKKENVIGTELAVKPVHPIQVFFIGIGEEADLEVGRIISKATGAEFQGVREKDLAEVIEELNGYF